MTTYRTTSGFPDLVGSMVVTNNNVDSYTSDTRGTGAVTNIGGPNLIFKVAFGKDKPYNINANANGNGYNGTANNNGPTAAEESWSATASTAGTADALDSAYESDEETAKKSAAS